MIAVSPSYYPNSPNDTSLHEFTMWTFKIHGTFGAPCGIRAAAAENIGIGLRFGLPTYIIPPRVLRVGVRFEW